MWAWLLNEAVLIAMWACVGFAISWFFDVKITRRRRKR